MAGTFQPLSSIQLLRCDGNFYYIFHRRDVTARVIFFLGGTRLGCACVGARLEQRLIHACTGKLINLRPGIVQLDEIGDVS